MFGNGARTGMIVAIIVAVRQAILKDRHLALAVFFVAAAGAATQGTAECRIVSTAIRAAGAITTACAFLYLRINTFFVFQDIRPYVST